MKLTINLTVMLWTRPLTCLSLSSVWKWIRVRVFSLEYCSLPVLYYHPLNVETRVKKFKLILTHAISSFGVVQELVKISPWNQEYPTWSLSTLKGGQTLGTHSSCPTHPLHLFIIFSSGKNQWSTSQIFARTYCLWIKTNQANLKLVKNIMKRQIFSATDIFVRRLLKGQESTFWFELLADQLLIYLHDKQSTYRDMWSTFRQSHVFQHLKSLFVIGCNIWRVDGSDGWCCRLQRGWSTAFIWSKVNI